MLVVVGALWALTGCGLLPPLPTPVPTSVIPPTTPEPTSTTSGGLLSPDGFDAAQRMAVRVRNIGCGTLSTGSGFALDEHSLVTNKHVVAGASTLELSTYDGRDLTAETVSTAALADLAIVRTVEALPTGPGLADDDPRIGDAVSVVGYPEGQQLTVTDGYVVATATDPLHETFGEVLVTDAPVEPGSSGSAALTADGRIGGVVYAKSSDGRSYVLPVSTLRTLLDDDASFTPAPACIQD